MLAHVHINRLHEYVSIQHLGMIGEDGAVTLFDEHSSHENYNFTPIDDHTTQLDIQLTQMPDDRVEMFNQMRPKALELLKNLCETH
jgi:hypothetical protein